MTDDEDIDEAESPEITDGATDAPDPAFCEVHGCVSDPKSEGLCVKHLIALRRGEADAVAAHDRWLATRPGACVDKPKQHWKTRNTRTWKRRLAEAARDMKEAVAAPPTEERKADAALAGRLGALSARAVTNATAKAIEETRDMTTRDVQCAKCGSKFGTNHGLKIHMARAHGGNVAAGRVPRPAGAAPLSVGPPPAIQGQRQRSVQRFAERIGLPHPGVLRDGSLLFVLPQGGLVAVDDAGDVHDVDIHVKVTASPA